MYYILSIIFAVSLGGLSGFAVKSLPQIKTMSHNLDLADLDDIDKQLQGQSILTIDLSQLKQKISNIPYVKSVSLKSTFPNTLHINIIRREPCAVLWNHGKLSLIDSSGVIISHYVTQEDKKKYIFVVSDNNTVDLKSIIEAITHSKINGKVSSIRFVNSRRYDIILSNGLVLKLPEKNSNKALKIFDFLNSKHNLIKHNMIVDMRLLPEKVFLRNLS